MVQRLVRARLLSHITRVQPGWTGIRNAACVAWRLVAASGQSVACRAPQQSAARIQVHRLWLQSREIGADQHVNTCDTSNGSLMPSQREMAIAILRPPVPDGSMGFA